jgi:hypothetical protein
MEVFMKRTIYRFIMAAFVLAAGLSGCDALMEFMGFGGSPEAESTTGENTPARYTVTYLAGGGGRNRSGRPNGERGNGDNPARPRGHGHARRHRLCGMENGQ